MNVKRFLSLPFTEEFQLLAGELGLSNEITGVNILDNPQSMDWLSPGELIVTSGYFFKESPEALERFLKSFKRLNIPAVCIKPQIYLNPLPKQLIDLCNTLEIPLIEIPYGLAFSKIMTTVMNLLTDSATESVQMALDINAKFLEYGIEGDDINYLREKLELLLDNPLLITNSDWTFLSNTHSDAFLPYAQQNNELTYFDINCLAIVPQKLEKLKHPVNVIFKDQSSGMILPVFFKDVTYGYMIVLQKNRPLLKQDYIALEHAAFSIALKIVHQAEKERIENRVLRDFYRELLSGHSPIENLRAYDIEFNYDIPYSVFLFSVNDPQQQVGNIVQRKYDEDRLMRNILNLMNAYNHPMNQDLHVFKQGAYFIGLIGQDSNQSVLSEQSQRTFFNDFDRFIRNSFASDMRINIYVGSQQAIAHLNRSFNEALKMIRFTKKEQSGIYFAENFYFENFFQTHIKDPEATEFINHYLSPLLEHDAESDSSLLETLKVFLDHHQNLAAASRALFIHRNTLLYRIDKIESLLDSKLADPSTALSLALALKFLNDYPLKMNPPSL